MPTNQVALNGTPATEGNAHLFQGIQNRDDHPAQDVLAAKLKNHVMGAAGGRLLFNIKFDASHNGWSIYVNGLGDSESHYANFAIAAEVIQRLGCKREQGQYEVELRAIHESGFLPTSRLLSVDVKELQGTKITIKLPREQIDGGGSVGRRLCCINQQFRYPADTEAVSVAPHRPSSSTCLGTP
ncbi:unnamed protein product [Sympodiomycopsis kandeliae]